MFVVTGVSGNTGSVVADTLLAQKRAVRVVVRDAKKAEAWKAKGAEIAVAELDDQAALTKAFQGAEGAYVLLPPDYASPDPNASNAKRADTIAKAIDAAGVKHVVLLSSVGAQHDAGTGPIVSLHRAEQAFAKTKAATTFVRAAYFMENIGSSLYALPQGQFPTFFKTSLKFPMIATEDIGKTAAKALLEGPNGHQIIELSGPKDYDQNDVAAALSRIVKKDVKVQEGPTSAMQGALEGAGLPPVWAGLFKEMTEGLNDGHVAFEGKNARAVRGTVPLESVLEKLVAAGSPAH
ncbi:MAG TPA: NmrA family NAD(P)-binding protein [Polyangiaceae bacterium]